MHTQTSRHFAHVDAWLHEVTADATAPQLVDLLQRALVAMWQGAKVTLGEVTLTAIVDRVLYTAAERHPFVTIAKIDGTPMGFEVRQSGDIQNVHRLREVVRFVLIEFLTVLGNLTDEILTPTLHAALTTVGREEPRRVGTADDAEEEEVR
jgi:hypothetical protein